MIVKLGDETDERSTQSQRERGGGIDGGYVGAMREVRFVEGSHQQVPGGRGVGLDGYRPRRWHAPATATTSIYLSPHFHLLFEQHLSYPCAGTTKHAISGKNCKQKQRHPILGTLCTIPRFALFQVAAYLLPRSVIITTTDVSLGRRV